MDWLRETAVALLSAGALGFFGTLVVAAMPSRPTNVGDWSNIITALMMFAVAAALVLPRYISLFA